MDQSSLNYRDKPVGHIPDNLYRKGDTCLERSRILLKTIAACYDIVATISVDNHGFDIWRGIYLYVVLADV